MSLGRYASAGPLSKTLNRLPTIQHVRMVVLATAADTPLVQGPITPLELKHASFVTSMAHCARLVMSARALSSGAARDVSGVLRVTAGGGVEGGTEQEAIGEGREVLYFVGGDGNVKVFERGEPS